jgi:hypothetical protein
MNRLRPLIIHQNEPGHGINQGPFIQSCVGISPGQFFKTNIKISLIRFFANSTSNKS